MSIHSWLEQAERADAALFAAVARMNAPALDRAMRRLSGAANYSRLWLGASALMALTHGEEGRRAAADGLASVAVTATIVNVALKPLLRRPRPERRALLPRHVRMPRTRSFPSGHAASAFAFATGVARTQPAIGRPLQGLAALVSYSRVHTGVHYPGDVIVGALIGGSLSKVTCRARERHETTSAE